MNFIKSIPFTYSYKSLMKLLALAFCLAFVNVTLTACSDKDTLSNNQSISLNTSGNDKLFYAYLALDHAIKNNDLDTVKNSIDTFLELDPQKAPLMEVVAWLLVNGHYDDAVEVLHSLLKINPNDFNATLLLVEAYIEAQEKEKAVKTIENYIKKHPENTQASVELAVMYIKLEMYDEANTLFAKVKTEDMTPVFLYYYASSLKQTENLNQAKEKLKLAISKQNDFTEALFELASIEDSQDNIKQAIEYYNKVLEVDNTYYFAISRLMYLYISNKEVDKAIKLSKISEEAISALYDVLPVSIDEGYYEEVSKVLDYAESIQELNDELLFYKAAIAYQYKKDIKTTLESLYKIPDTMQNYRKVIDLIIQIELESKMYSEALFHTKKAIELFDDNINFYTLAMQLFFTLQQSKEALIFGKTKVDEIFNNNEISLLEADYLFYYASMLVVANENFDSEKYFNKILDVNPAHYEAMNSLAYHYALEGIKLEKALELVEVAIKNVPNKSYLYDTLAWVQYKMQDYQNAYTNIKKSLDLAKQEGKIDPAIKEHYQAIEQKIKSL